MSNAGLKEALNNCLINFDRRVMVTELLEEYELPYEEVHETLAEYLDHQAKEFGAKYEKRFVVHGEQDGVSTEVYTVVKEADLAEWLAKLKNVESALYSVEVAGGAKAPAPIFKPMSIAKDVKLAQRTGATVSNGCLTNDNEDGSTGSTTEAQVKVEIPESVQKGSGNEPAVKSGNKTSKAKEERTSPEFTKAVAQRNNKKGISNYFSSLSNPRKANETKDLPAPAAKRPSTPRKVDDFFKKQLEKPATALNSKSGIANTSVQLFADDENEEVQSSDEEEHLDALKRKIFDSDHEMKTGEDDVSTSGRGNSKRRRIEDSDDDGADDEDVKPEQKYEKRDSGEVEEVQPKSETYLDENGFVITVKSKQRTQTSPARSKRPLKTSPPTPTVSKSKTSSPPQKKETTTASASVRARKAGPTAKTKQARIMNFFTKK